MREVAQELIAKLTEPLVAVAIGQINKQAFSGQQFGKSADVRMFR